MSVSIKDNGYNALVKRTIGFKPVTIRTGLLEKDGAQEHAGGDGVTLLQIFVWNHFGVVAKDGLGWAIPPRPVITDWFDAHESELRDKLTVLMQQVVAGVLTRDQILNLMGQYCVGQIQQEIANHVDPPNAPATIKAKGSDTPLVDKGQLRSAISYDIQEGK
jgi:hypothetical protein